MVWILQCSVFCTLHCGLFVFTVHFKRSIFYCLVFMFSCVHGVHGRAYVHGVQLCMQNHPLVFHPLGTLATSLSLHTVSDPLNPSLQCRWLSFIWHMIENLLAWRLCWYIEKSGKSSARLAGPSYSVNYFIICTLWSQSQVKARRSAARLPWSS